MNTRPPVRAYVLGDGKQHLRLLFQHRVALEGGQVPTARHRQTFVDDKKVSLIERGQESVGEPLKPPVRVLLVVILNLFRHLHWHPYRAAAAPQ